MKLALFLLVLLAGSVVAQLPNDRLSRIGGHLSGQSLGNAVGTVLSGGKYYRDARLSAVTPAGANISSRDGKATVPISSLPGSLKAEALAWQHRAAALAAAATERAAERAARAPGEIQTVVWVVQDVPEGILAARADGQTILLKGHPDAGRLADGEKVSFRGVPDGLFKYTTALKTEATVRVYRVLSMD